MLAALPLLLPGGSLPPQHYESRLHSAHLPDILLACYVKLLYQPNSLLCNEQKVSAVTADQMKIYNDFLDSDIIFKKQCAFVVVTMLIC